MPAAEDHFLNPFTHKKTDACYMIIFNHENDGCDMTILNHKKLNEKGCTQHSKIESKKHATQLIKIGMFLAALDIQDAVYSVLVNRKHQRLFIKVGLSPSKKIFLLASMMHSFFYKNNFIRTRASYLTKSCFSFL